MNIKAIISYPDFKTKVINILKERTDISKENYMEKVGELTMKYAEDYRKTLPGNSPMPWQEWFCGVDFGNDKYKKYFEKISPSTAGNVKKTSADLEWAIGFHYRLHAEVDCLEDFAHKLDEYLFKAKFEHRGVAVFEQIAEIEQQLPPNYPNKNTLKKPQQDNRPEYPKLANLNVERVHLGALEVARFQDSVNTDAFREWRLAATKSLYSETLETLGPQSVAFPSIGNTTYPIALMQSFNDQSIMAPNVSNLDIEQRPVYPTPIDIQEGNASLSAMNIEMSESQCNYLEMMLITEKIRRPNQPGYALSSLQLDANGCVTGFRAKTCHYMDNVRTCHHIEIALEKAFQNGVNPEETDNFYDSIGRPFISLDANNLHLSVSGVQPMYPLISVQAVFLFRSRGNWNVSYVKRNMNVAVAAGAYQFVPAGGFETIGRFKLSNIGELEVDRLTRGFDVKDALLREFLEEIFADKTMVAGGGASNVHHLPGMDMCHDLIDEDRLEIRSLGVVFDLVRLRPEFSYIIILRDEQPQKLNYHFQDNNLAMARFGHTNDEEADELESMQLNNLRNRLQKEVWHESSAGLGELALTHLENDPEFSKEV